MWAKCLFLFLFSGFQIVEPRRTGQDTSWDYLVFTQHWTPTVCKEWVHKNPSHTCSLPRKPDTWTIHGIWPNKLGTMGPQFCNKTWLFDPEEVRPIEASLEQAWINVEKETPLYDLWAHEWNKHGTCAASIEPLNTQIKYFSKGIDLLQKYTMDRILIRRKIVPSNSKQYSLDDFRSAIIELLQVMPEIECRHENGHQYLFELRLCFSKSFGLRNCEPSQTTNCNAGQGIIYPEMNAPNFIYVQLYRLITFLQWFTL